MVVDSNYEVGHFSRLQIDVALSQVLRSAPFCGSRQSRTLLKYLVEHSRAGGEVLKERTIGIEVFRRKPNYSTAEDPIVRARVGEVRKRLAQYYMSQEAQGSAVQIVIPFGSYRPTFVPHPGVNNGGQEFADTEQPGMAAFHLAEDRASLETAVPVSRSARNSRLRVWGLAAAAACVALLAAWIGIPKWTKSDLDLFWGPFLDSKRPVVIYCGTVPMYELSIANFYRELSLMKPGEVKQPAVSAFLPPLTEGQELTAKDLLINRDTFIGTSAVTAAVNVTTLLKGHRQSFDLRVGPGLAFEDLHGAPAVLIGGFENLWTINMNPDLNFYFDRGLNIRERGGQGRVWSTMLGANSTITEDYAIVSRAFSSKTGAPVVILSGITNCGSRAAGEFLTDPAQMKKLGKIPRDALEHKNLELVLHTSLINCAPISVDIVASHFW